MKILLIAPASGKWRHVGRRRLLNGRTFRFSLLSLLSVAAESPPGSEVRIVDEQVDQIPWDADVDLVGITCMTALAPRAYEIARRFRQRGIPVVLGGMHPTLCSEEAIRQAGHDWVTWQFYRPWRIVRRLWRYLRRPGSWATLFYLAGINAAYWGRTLRDDSKITWTICYTP